MQGGRKLTNGHFYAISYVTPVTENHACSQTLQWSTVTNVQVYDLLLSTTQNAKPEEMMAYWKQVLWLWIYDMLCMNDVVPVIFCILCNSKCVVLLISCIAHCVK